ncbi:MAG: ATP-binding protein [Leptolyngbya sp. RL_3_1]|nr:ATP-binding protein [Leptolyngbya sp. RL_3_1]
MERGLLEWVGDAGTLLSQQVKVTESVVNYLLAAQPSAEVPGEEAPMEEPVQLLTAPQTVAVDWSSLVLPKSVLSTLKYLSRQASQRQQFKSVSGLMVLLTGQVGTGKTLAAMAIAADLQRSLRILDLAIFAADHDTDLLTPPTDEATHSINAFTVTPAGRSLVWPSRHPRAHRAGPLVASPAPVPQFDPDHG